MNYALIENNIVVNIIWLYDGNANEFPNAIKLEDRPVQIGDVYKDGRFYRNNKEILTSYEEAMIYKSSLIILDINGDNTIEQATKLKSDIIALTSLLTDDQAASYSHLCQRWYEDEEIKVNERRYYPPTNKLYKCLVTHISKIDNAPDVSLLWKEITCNSANTPREDNLISDLT